MPELPEVETTLRGIAPHLRQQTIEQVIVRDTRLRWPIDPAWVESLRGQKVLGATRRGKYLIVELTRGALIMHLGMSGNLRWVPLATPAQKHDHVDFIFTNQRLLRFTDPRRFGAILYTEVAALLHPLLADLGPEPLSANFTGEYLWQRARGRNQAVKNFIMDGKIVVGVGNIYASEALFLAGIRPSKRANKVSAAHYLQLAAVIKTVLANAIEAGGTTLRDFVGGDGKPGYFKQQLHVYGREGEPCLRCATIIKAQRLGQRSSFYCPHCQR
jgi:formamidopyrimidine-DNA glycosylase